MNDFELAKQILKRADEIYYNNVVKPTLTTFIKEGGTFTVKPKPGKSWKYAKICERFLNHLERV